MNTADKDKNIKIKTYATGVAKKLTNSRLKIAPSIRQPPLLVDKKRDPAELIEYT